VPTKLSRILAPISTPLSTRLSPVGTRLASIGIWQCYNRASASVLVPAPCRHGHGLTWSRTTGRYFRARHQAVVVFLPLNQAQPRQVYLLGTPHRARTCAVSASHLVRFSVNDIIISPSRTCRTQLESRLLHTGIESECALCSQQKQQYMTHVRLLTKPLTSQLDNSTAFVTWHSRCGLRVPSLAGKPAC
jgi:hypothetical protein